MSLLLALVYGRVHFSGEVLEKFWRSRLQMSCLHLPASLSANHGSALQDAALDVVASISTLTWLNLRGCHRLSATALAKLSCKTGESGCIPARSRMYVLPWPGVHQRLCVYCSGICPWEGVVLRFTL